MSLIHFILRRKPFKGQFRLFSWLFKKNLLPFIQTIDQPLLGNFRIHLYTKNFIDASIYYTGDYENYLKVHYQKYIHPGDTVLDAGANIGFHSLFFAQLTGETGKVIAFEPIPINYNALMKNIALNDFPQVIANNIALGNENCTLKIHIDRTAQNPGAFNLLEDGEKNCSVICEKGDDFLTKHRINKVNFIKIDVEGYELEVVKGLKDTISKDRPVINFEYDSAYQIRNHHQKNEIFAFLRNLNYSFLAVDGYGQTCPVEYNDNLLNAEIIALP